MQGQFLLSKKVWSVVILNCHYRRIQHPRNGSTILPYRSKLAFPAWPVELCWSAK